MTLSLFYLGRGVCELKTSWNERAFGVQSMKGYDKGSGNR
jgi:hypothetical protein